MTKITVLYLALFYEPDVCLGFASKAAYYIGEDLSLAVVRMRPSRVILAHSLLRRPKC